MRGGMSRRGGALGVSVGEVGFEIRMLSWILPRTGLSLFLDSYGSLRSRFGTGDGFFDRR